MRVLEYQPVELDVLRREARDVLDVVIESRCRQGEDPWEFLPELPTVDEHVVATLRASRLDQRGQDPSHRLPPHSEYLLLRRIALDHPELTPAVWTMIGRMGAAGVGVDSRKANR